MNIIKKQFADFLKFRTSNLNVEELEMRYGFCLPPIYRSFISNFENILGDIYKEENGSLRTLTYYRYTCAALNNIDLLFEDFMQIEDVFKYRNNSDSWIENNVIPITIHSHGGVILLGTESENIDKIYFEYDEGLTLIENNIYSFLKNLEFVISDGIDIDMIYKNWDEEFWRIKK